MSEISVYISAHIIRPVTRNLVGVHVVAICDHAMFQPPGPNTKPRVVDRVASIVRRDGTGVPPT